MNQATKPAVGSIEIQEAALLVDAARLTSEKGALSECEARLATQRQRVYNVEQEVSNARTALGKLKLTAAIDLIKSVYAEAPAGSAASRDISALTEHLMWSRMGSTLDAMPFEGVFASRGTVTGRVGPTSPQVGSNLPRSETARSITNMTTSAGAGQPRQAKPSPYVPKAGDKVRLVNPWYPGSKEFVGKVLTVDSVSQGAYVYFKEFPEGQNCAVVGGHIEPAGAFRVGDKLVCARPDLPCNKGRLVTVVGFDPSGTEVSVLWRDSNCLEYQSVCKFDHA